MKKTFSYEDAAALLPEVQRLTQQAVEDVDELPETANVPNVRKFLGEALDATSDGMPADFVAMTLYAALGALQEGHLLN